VARASRPLIKLKIRMPLIKFCSVMEDNRNNQASEPWIIDLISQKGKSGE